MTRKSFSFFWLNLARSKIMLLICEDEIDQLNIFPEFRNALKYMNTCYPHIHLLIEDKPFFPIEDVCSDGACFFTKSFIHSCDLPCFEDHVWNQNQSKVVVVREGLIITIRKYTISRKRTKEVRKENKYLGVKAWILEVCVIPGEKFYFWWCERNPWMVNGVNFYEPENYPK